MASTERRKSSDEDRSGLAGSIGGAVALTVALALYERILPTTWLAVSLALAAAALAILGRRAVHRTLTSLPFAVAILFVIGTLVILGTFVPPKHAHGIRSFLALDSFHFRALFAILALSLAFIAIRPRASWGLRLAHAGVIVLLVGGLAGRLWGLKGTMDLREGVTATRFTDDQGRPVDLGFGVRLDRFEVDRYPTEYRLYVYRHDLEMVASLGIEASKRWTAIEGTNRSFRVKGVYPDFVVRTELRDDPEGAPILRFDGGILNDRDVLVADQGRTVYRFAWELDEKNPPVATTSQPERHELALENQTVEVHTGATYRIGAVDVGVLEYLPDFAYDREEKRAYSKSPLPANPALRVRVEDKERWLFAARPGDGLVYTYRPPQEPAEREVLFVGRAREILEYRFGDLVGRRPFTTEEVRERAVEFSYPATASDQWRLPVLEIELDGGETGFVSEGEPVAFDERVLVLDRKPDIKAYRSRVTVDGEAKTIEVNQPLVRNGFHLYQANYKPEDPTWSGIQVVKDPGLWTVYAGMALICLGLVQAFYLRRRP